MIISVGIPTDGEPVTEQTSEGTLLKNMRIGLGFHWERTISAFLPGEIISNDDPVFRLINRLPLETYLECVVGSEMNPESPAEFLKAHSVISRSWTVGKVLALHDHSDEGKIDSAELFVTWEDTCGHKGFHVCSDDHCQRYQGIQPIPGNVLEAIRSTAGEILVSQSGKLVDARFSKCCGGRTEIFSTCWQDREEECLESIYDPWCDLSELDSCQREHILKSVLKDYDLSNGGGYEWKTEVTADKIRHNLLTQLGRDVGEIIDIQITRRGLSGRGFRLRIDGSEGSIEIGKELIIRRLLSETCLFSSAFTTEKTVEGDRTVFHLSGRGWGHGVGLCQIGAARMAIAGRSYRDILEFYYPCSKVALI